MQKPIINLSRLEHRGNIYLKVHLPNTSVAKKLATKQIRKVSGRKWSQTHGCWYVPWSQDIVNGLTKIFDIIELPESLSLLTPKTTTQLKPTACKTSTDYQKKYTNKEGEQKIRTVGSQLILKELNKDYFKAYVPYTHKRWIEIIRDIPGRRWNVDEGYWKIPYVKDSFRRLWQLIGKEYIECHFKINKAVPENYSVYPSTTPFQTKHISSKSKVQFTEQQQKAITALEERLMLEGKRMATIKTYRDCLKGLLYYYPNTKPSQITQKALEQYIIYRKRKDNISDSTQNQIVNALNAFYIRVVGRERKQLKLERPKRRKRLPNVLSEQEIEILMKSVDNLKHKCMLLLIYSAGLRKGELLRLRVNDLNFHRKSIFVKDAKGGKDRYTFFSDLAIPHIQAYKKMYQPKYWLFEGQTGGPYSASSLQSIFISAKEQSKVNPYITLHGLRHSFATHLVERGVPLHVVKQLLGHENIKTTEIYLHISNRYMKELKSPLDNLEI